MKLKQKLEFVGGALAAVALTSLTGCMHGETFAEWRQGLFENDPWAVPVVEPNDTLVDEHARPPKDENGNNVRIKVRLMPSQYITSFLESNRDGGRQENQRLLVSFATRMKSAFANVKQLNFIDTENELVERFSAPTPTLSAPESAYVMSLNVVSLDTRAVGPSDLPIPPVVKPEYSDLLKRKEPTYEGDITLTLAMLNPSGEQRMSLEATAHVSRAASHRQAAEQLIANAVNSLLRQYTERMAGVAYVRSMRGNGLFAEVSFGSERGVQPGASLEFFQFEELTDPLTGQKRRRETVIGTGKVLGSRFIEANSLWAKLDDFHYRRVHLGTFVRVMKVGR